MAGREDGTHAGFRALCWNKVRVRKNWQISEFSNPECSKTAKDQSRDATLKKSSFQCGMKISVEN